MGNNLEPFSTGPALPLSPGQIGDGALGGLVSFKALASDPAGVEGAVYYNTGSKKLRSYLNGAWGDVGGAGGGAPVGLRLVAEFGTGGSIAEWQSVPVLNNIVTYGLAGSSRSKGAFDYPLIVAPADGDYTVRIDYGSDVNIVVTPRVRQAAGTSWADRGSITLLAAQVRRTFTVTLAAGEALGLHNAPGGGGIATLSSWGLVL